MSTHDVVMISVFGLVFMVICVILQKIRFANHLVRVAISACIAAMCVMGLFDGSGNGLSFRNEGYSINNASSYLDPSLQNFLFVLLILGVPVVLGLWLWVKLSRPRGRDRILHSEKSPWATDFKVRRPSGRITMKDGKLYEEYE